MREKTTKTTPTRPNAQAATANHNKIVLVFESCCRVKRGRSCTGKSPPWAEPGTQGGGGRGGITLRRKQG